MFKPRTVVSIDTEGTGLDPWGLRRLFCNGEELWAQDQVFMISMADYKGDTWCCSWKVSPFTRKAEVRKEDVEYLKSVLRIPGIQIVFHNSKYDCRMLSNLD